MRKSKIIIEMIIEHKGYQTWDELLLDLEAQIIDDIDNNISMNIENMEGEHLPTTGTSKERI